MVWERYGSSKQKRPQRAFSVSLLYRLSALRGKLSQRPQFKSGSWHHIDAKTAVSFISPDAGTDRVFDNADSFAMVFDRTWKQLRGSNKAERSQEEHLEAVLEAMADHPFLISSPDMARQVAAFRIRLLELA